MSAYLYLAEPSNLRVPLTDVPAVMLHDNGYYWFLYRYFESANLERSKGELIDLYGGGVIDGYQLHRLRSELEQALQDVGCKPDSWQVLTGWNGESVSVESENWCTVEKTKMLQLITAILALVQKSSNSRKLVCDGD